MSEPSTATDELVVEDNPEESRFEARLGDRIVGIAEYELPDDQGPITFTHTEVLPDVEGQGVGGRLARTALDDVRRRGLRVIVECPFIASWVRRHRDYDDLIDAVNVD
jgi:uncharacterized protein